MQRLHHLLNMLSFAVCSIAYDSFQGNACWSGRLRDSWAGKITPGAGMSVVGPTTSFSACRGTALGAADARLLIGICQYWKFGISRLPWTRSPLALAPELGPRGPESHWLALADAMLYGMRQQ